MMYEDGRIPWWLQIACSLCRHCRETSSAVEVALRACGVCFVNWRGEKESAHPVEEIHQLSQLRSLETQQIRVFAVAFDQVIKITGEVKRRGVEGIEVS